MVDPAADKRRHPRYRTDLEITIFPGKEPIQARITQISRGGCLISPPLPALDAHSVRISFRLADELPSINCKGEVVYTISDIGTGIAFTEISAYNQEIITSHFEGKLAAEGRKGS